MNKLFDVKTVFENDTYYTFSGNTNIALKETKRKFDHKYIGLSERNCGFLDVAFLLEGLKNVTLDFGGAKITLQGKIQPFLIDKCENITIKNVIVEYDRSFFSEFDIIEISSGRVVMAPVKNFPVWVKDGGLHVSADTWETELDYGTILGGFDRDTRVGKDAFVAGLGAKILEGKMPPSHMYPYGISAEGENVVLHGDIPEGYPWDTNTRVSFAHERRDKSSVAMYHSKDIYIENYRIINGAGMGLLAIHTENVYIDKLLLTYDELSHGFTTNAADAIHFIGTYGTVSIKNSVFEGMIDDAINVHSNFHSTIGAEGRYLTIRRSEISHGVNAHLELFCPGDEIAIFRANTMEEQGRYTITHMRILEDYVILLELDRDIEVANEGDIVENITTNPDLYIENCTFGKANSHLRLQTRGKVRIRNCDSELPFWLTGDANYWFESSPIRDLIIEDCHFTTDSGYFRSLARGVEYTEKAPYYHSNVTIRNCTFERECPVLAYSTANFTFENNRQVDGKPLVISCKDCINLKTDVEVNYLEDNRQVP